MKKFLLLSIVSALLFSCSNGDTPNIDGSSANLSVKTYSVFNVTYTTATYLGMITSFGTSDVTAAGLCYGTAPSPTISGLHTTDAVTDASFSSTITALAPNTTYYVRAYATNADGTKYGGQITFTTLASQFITGTGVVDADGNTYNSIKINGVEWMKKNLNVSKYKNGDVIPEVTDPAVWTSLTTGAWCYYENDTANGPVFGKLYNWYAVNDPRGLAPAGWHIPTDAEWSSLTTFLGGEAIAGQKIKEDGTVNWAASASAYGTNQAGFTALPSGDGYLNYTYVATPAPTPADLFKDKAKVAYWWSATANGSVVWSRNVTFDSNGVTRSGVIKTSGLAVRCVKG
ncbi:fibrobacter succinogenes major paralogous domain-containing protein [Flavobacterium sp. SUN052]|uniref:fibrobacter succinogenes major paralogous domain-containing protein n=1 Tax=Flavobacterium sp. SUN052 TaxID=3002441 RepID=UPI00237DE1AB|nr:fibrobacter succinogenes major paralogous domain-containing protein [Flavobacterium sp. SUN052]MEC4003201.1 fibrobacter succinogenes major paralogous domain-containing protein [Flavobacterium sp. SUN052]